MTLVVVEHLLKHTHVNADAVQESILRQTLIVLVQQNLGSLHGRESNYWDAHLAQKATVRSRWKNLRLQLFANAGACFLEKLPPHVVGVQRGDVVLVHWARPRRKLHETPSAAHHLSSFAFIAFRSIPGETRMSKPAMASVGITLSA